MDEAQRHTDSLRVPALLAAAAFCAPDADADADAAHADALAATFLRWALPALALPADGAAQPGTPRPLVVILEALRPALVADDVVLRRRSTLLIARLLAAAAPAAGGEEGECEPPSPSALPGSGAGIADEDAAYLLEFCATRLQDFACTAEVLAALRWLLGPHNVLRRLPPHPPPPPAAGEGAHEAPHDPPARALTRVLLRELNIRSLPRGAREDAFRVFGLLLTRALDDLLPLGSEFILGFLQAFDGERDPRVLLRVLRLVPFLPRFSHFEQFSEDVFEALACYVPVVLPRTLPAPARATAASPPEPALFRTDLVDALDTALAASPLFAPHVIPLLQERLARPEDDAGCAGGRGGAAFSFGAEDAASAEDALRTLARVWRAYPFEKSAPFLPDITVCLRNRALAAVGMRRAGLSVVAAAAPPPMPAAAPASAAATLDVPALLLAAVASISATVPRGDLSRWLTLLLPADAARVPHALPAAAARGSPAACLAVVERLLAQSPPPLPHLACVAIELPAAAAALPGDTAGALFSALGAGWSDGARDSSGAESPPPLPSPGGARCAVECVAAQGALVAAGLPLPEADLTVFLRRLNAAASANSWGSAPADSVSHSPARAYRRHPAIVPDSDDDDSDFESDTDTDTDTDDSGEEDRSRSAAQGVADGALRVLAHLAAAEDPGLARAVSDFVLAQLVDDVETAPPVYARRRVLQAVGGVLPLFRRACAALAVAAAGGLAADPAPARAVEALGTLAALVDAHAPASPAHAAAAAAALESHEHVHTVASARRLDASVLPALRTLWSALAVSPSAATRTLARALVSAAAHAADSRVAAVVLPGVVRACGIGAGVDCEAAVVAALLPPRGSPHANEGDDADRAAALGALICGAPADALAQLLRRIRGADAFGGGGEPFFAVVAEAEVARALLQREDAPAEATAAIRRLCAHAAAGATTTAAPEDAFLRVLDGLPPLATQKVLGIATQELLPHLLQRPPLMRVLAACVAHVAPDAALPDLEMHPALLDSLVNVGCTCGSAADDAASSLLALGTLRSLLRTADSAKWIVESGAVSRILSALLDSATCATPVPAAAASSAAASAQRRAALRALRPLGRAVAPVSRMLRARVLGRLDAALDDDIRAVRREAMRTVNTWCTLEEVEDARAAVTCPAELQS